MYSSSAEASYNQASCFKNVADIKKKSAIKEKCHTAFQKNIYLKNDHIPVIQDLWFYLKKKKKKSCECYSKTFLYTMNFQGKQQHTAKLRGCLYFFLVSSAVYKSVPWRIPLVCHGQNSCLQGKCPKFFFFPNAFDF